MNKNNKLKISKKTPIKRGDDEHYEGEKRKQLEILDKWLFIKQWRGQRFVVEARDATSELLERQEPAKNIFLL